MTEKELEQIRCLCRNYYPSEIWSHALRVAAIVEQDIRYFLMQPEQKRTAVAITLMHDLLEDTSIKETEIADQIKNPGELAIVIYNLRRLTRKQDELYVEYIRRIRDGGQYALLVKQADLADHLLQQQTLTDSLKRRYNKAAKILTESEYK